MIDRIALQMVQSIEIGLSMEGRDRLRRWCNRNAKGVITSFAPSEDLTADAVPVMAAPWCFILASCWHPKASGMSVSPTGFFKRRWL
jgi:hypothetical protein